MFDGNGNWTSDFSAQADRDNGIKILASRFDNIFIADIKESFENCLTKDGQITPIGNFNMGGHRITNLDDGVNSTDAVTYGQLQEKADDNAVVKLSGAQTIADVKTFTSSPVLPTPAISDNSTKGATTEWVNNQEYLGYPDYAHATVLSKANGTVSSNGWLHFQGANNTYGYTITINGFAFELSDAYGTTDELLVPVKAGDTYTCSNWSYISSLKYIPNR